MSKDPKHERSPLTSSALKEHIEPVKPNTQTEGNVAVAMNTQAQPTAITEWSQTEKDAALKEHKTWSGVFRFLISKGYTRGQVSKLTGKRYQHVRNVLITPVGKAAAASNPVIPETTGKIGEEA